MAYINILEAIYPIGAMYLSIQNTSPAEIIGGTWSKIEGQYLIGADDNYEVTSTGGTTNYTLTTNNMPSHYHTVWWKRTNITINSSGNSHVVVNHTNTGASGPHSGYMTASGGGATFYGYPALLRCQYLGQDGIVPLLFGEVI